MSRQLPDVNVLLALVAPRHIHHEAASAWFSKSGQHGWATNAVTQLGLLRLLTNPAVTQGAVSVEAALHLVQQITAHPAHEWWALDRPVAPELLHLHNRIQGHQQWTDALLLRQAITHRGVLVTFDQGLSSLAGAAAAKHLHLLTA